MNVYVVTWEVDYEGMGLIGIYSSAELAVTAVETEISRSPHWDEITILEFPVDSDSADSVIHRWVGYAGAWCPAPPRGYPGIGE